MSELFDKARELLKVEDLAEKLGVKLRKQGRELRGACPLCSAGASTGTVFQVKPDKQTWRCFACEKYGDVVDLYAEANRLSVAEAAREITGDVKRDLASRPTPPRARPEDDGARERRILDLALNMWREAHAFAGSFGERYLLARKIAPEIVEQIGGLRFHANAPHSWDRDTRTWNRAPAIVAKAMSGGAWPGGVHVTYLTPDGLGKTTSLAPAKRMWGPQVEITGLGPRRCGAILIDPEDGLDMVIGEGIESALSLATWLYQNGKRRMRVSAALSLGALQGGERRDDDGCVDVWRARPDPAAPPFLVLPSKTDILEPLPRAFIAIDRDMSPVKVRGRTGRGVIRDFERDGEDRAKLCSELAERAWRAAGWSRATAMFPNAGGDWNDVLKGRA